MLPWVRRRGSNPVVLLLDESVDGSSCRWSRSSTASCRDRPVRTPSRSSEAVRPHCPRRSKDVQAIMVNGTIRQIGRPTEVRTRAVSPPISAMTGDLRENPSVDRTSPTTERPAPRQPREQIARNADRQGADQNNEQPESTICPAPAPARAWRSSLRDRLPALQGDPPRSAPAGPRAVLMVIGPCWRCSGRSRSGSRATSPPSSALPAGPGVVPGHLALVIARSAAVVRVLAGPLLQFLADPLSSHEQRANADRIVEAIERAPSDRGRPLPRSAPDLLTGTPQPVPSWIRVRWLVPGRFPLDCRVTAPRRLRVSTAPGTRAPVLRPPHLHRARRFSDRV